MGQQDVSFIILVDSCTIPVFQHSDPKKNHGTTSFVVLLIVPAFLINGSCFAEDSREGRALAA